MRKSVQFMFHLIFWIFTSLLVMFSYMLITFPSNLFGVAPRSQEYFTAILIILPIGAVIFYSSYFSLNCLVNSIVRFLWLAIGYALLIAILISIDKINTGEVDALFIMIVLISILYFNVFGFLFKSFIGWIKDKKIKAELEKDKLTSQLELLKSQINPHFLFNTLNNIDVLILDEPKRASNYLKKLSEILRFMLYETDTDKMPLSKEVEYIKKYIELQKIRTLNEKFVELKISRNLNKRLIAPMIFIHFVENAFKYATNKKIENAVSIRLDVFSNKVTFVCKNHINSGEVTTRENSGLGFNLVKQRLDLIYGKNYILDVSNEDNWYIVKLEIQTAND